MRGLPHPGPHVHSVVQLQLDSFISRQAASSEPVGAGLPPPGSPSGTRVRGIVWAILTFKSTLSRFIHVRSGRSVVI
jgi:hypothetical protein